MDQLDVKFGLCYKIIHKNEMLKSNQYICQNTDNIFTIIKLSQIKINDLITFDDILEMENKTIQDILLYDIDIDTNIKNNLYAIKIKDNYNIDDLLVIGCRCKHKLCYHTHYLQIKSIGKCCNIWITPFLQLCDNCKNRLIQLIHSIYCILTSRKSMIDILALNDTEQIASIIYNTEFIHLFLRKLLNIS